MAEYTVDYFHEQVCEFREACGSKLFWQKPAEIRALACKAIGFVFMATERKDESENERLAAVYQSAMQNYLRREFMLIMMGEVKEAA